MKSIFNFLAIALSAISLFSSLANAQSYRFNKARQVCTWKNPGLVIAIDDFCMRTNNLVIPSMYAIRGVANDQRWLNPMKVSIRGTCRPGQWVPAQYCWSQFYHICITGGPFGGGRATYGNNDCQRWAIERNGW